MHFDPTTDEWVTKDGRRIPRINTLRQAFIESATQNKRLMTFIDPLGQQQALAKELVRDQGKKIVGELVQGAEVTPIYEGQELVSYKWRPGGPPPEIRRFARTEGNSEVRITDPTTGGQKGAKAERYDLFPWGFATDEIARVYGFGASKYTDHNWRKGYKWGLSIAALLRHVFLWIGGQALDKESGLNHLAHAGFHVLTLMTYQNEKLGTDDRAVTVLKAVDEEVA